MIFRLLDTPSARIIKMSEKDFGTSLQRKSYQADFKQITETENLNLLSNLLTRLVFAFFLNGMTVFPAISSLNKFLRIPHEVFQRLGFLSKTVQVVEF